MIDLDNLGDGGTTIYGVTAAGLLGFGSGGQAGDFNGDGTPDLIIPEAGGGGNNATVYVVFGGDTLADGVDLANLGTDEGVKLTGETDSFAGRSVSSAGDVNGDGIDDVIIGADFTGATDAGAAYVVYGSQTLGAAPIDLTNLGDAGFVIQGNGSEGMGRSVFGIGDINGDGFDDIAVGANGNDDGALVGGAVYVIFGSDQGFPDTIDTNNLGSRGFQVVGANQGDAVGTRLTAGDFNEDGKADLVFNSGNDVAFLFSSDTTPSGTVTVGTDPNSFVLTTGVDGTKLLVSGDFDNDGRDDLAIGLPRDSQGGTDRGSISVLFASLGNNLDDPTFHGYLRSGTGSPVSDNTLVTGSSDNQQLGSNIAVPGDFNGDGGDDIAAVTDNEDLRILTSIFAGQDAYAIGDPPDGSGTDVDGVDGAGSAYVFAIGDLNADGLFDLMIGTPNADDADKGRVDVVFGALSGSGSDAGDSLTGGALGETVDGGAGNDTIFSGGGDDSVSGGIDADLLATGDGDDTIRGDPGDDRGYGQAGDDSVDGGDGNDSLFGNLGNDSLTGDAGDDMIKGHVGDDVVDGGDGNDLLFGGGGDDSVTGGTGADTVNGNSGADTVSGDDGDDVVRGQGGNDSVDGGAGNDTIRGMSGFDTMFGGAGDDLLSPGVGNDTCTGGAGDDIFEFAQGQGSNVITDFELNADMISVVGTTSIDDLAFFTINDDAIIRLASEGAFATLEITVQNTDTQALRDAITIGYNMGGNSPPPLLPDEADLLMP